MKGMRRGDVFMSPFNRGEFFVVRGRRVEIENSGVRNGLFHRQIGNRRRGGKCKVAIAVSVRRVLNGKVDSVELKHVEFKTTKYLKVPSVAFARRMMLLEAL